MIEEGVKEMNKFFVCGRNLIWNSVVDVEVLYKMVYKKKIGDGTYSGDTHE